MKKLLLNLCLCAMFCSCTLLTPTHTSTHYPPSGGNTGGIGGGGMIAYHGNYTVQLLQCTANRGNQEIEIVLLMTNRGVNEGMYLGASSSLAIDNYGNTLSGFGTQYYEFPTGVPVKVTVNRIKLADPRTTMLSYYKIEMKSSNNFVEFRNVPVGWMN